MLKKKSIKRFVHFFSFSQASLLLWTLDDAKERVRNPALSLSLHTHPAQVPLACHLITLDTARGLKYEKKYLPSAFYVGERWSKCQSNKKSSENEWNFLTPHHHASNAVCSMYISRYVAKTIVTQ